MFDNPRALLQLLPIIEVLVTFIDNIINVNVASPETEHQQTSATTLVSV